MYQIRQMNEEWKEIKRSDLVKYLAENYYLRNDFETPLGFVCSADYERAEKEVRKIYHHSKNCTFLYCKKHDSFSVRYVKC